MLFGLYLFVPINPPDLPNPVDRVFYTLCCCVVAVIPVLLGTPHTQTHLCTDTQKKKPRMKR